MCGNVHLFEEYWKHQADILVDMCRQEELGMPNIFITISPLERKFPYHNPLFLRWTKGDKYTRVQGDLTMNEYVVLIAIIEDILKISKWFTDCKEFSVRIEFQKRGTLHIHVVAWVTLAKARC